MSGEPSEDLPRQLAPAAFRRPGLVLLVAAYRLLAGLLVATPIAALFNATVSGYPRGDAELFDPGGLMLLEALRLGARGLPATLTGAGLPALVAVFVGLVPLAALIAGLSRSGPLSRAFLARAATFRVGTLALLWGVSLAAQILLAVLVVLLGGKLIDVARFTAKNEDLAYLALAAITGLVVIAAGLLRDLAAVAAVADGDRFYVSNARALLTVLRRPGRVLGAYAPRALLALGLLIAAFALAPPRGEALGAAFALHEGAIVLGVFLRASWLAAAIRLVSSAAPPHAAAVAPAPVTDVSPADTMETASFVEAPGAEEVVEAPAGTEAPLPHPEPGDAGAGREGRGPDDDRGE